MRPLAAKEKEKEKTQTGYWEVSFIQKYIIYI